MDYTIDQVAAIIKGTLSGGNAPGQVLSYLSLDSRKIIRPEGTLFFALKTRGRDGSQYIEELYKNGVRSFVTSNPEIRAGRFPGASIIRVTDTLKGLQRLAIYHRERFGQLPVIGITGSNGKTVVKEWLNQLLEGTETIVRSPKSYNSQIGVPLSILHITQTDTLGIFEAGISKKGEMGRLQKIIQPQIGILTNIGQAHDEGFSGMAEKLQEKLLLFKKSNLLVYCADQVKVAAAVVQFKKKINPSLELFSWGSQEGCRLRITGVHKAATRTRIEGLYENRRWSITIPFTDEASLENALHCWAVILVLKKFDPAVRRKFASLYPIAMRLELKKGINHCSVINDTYSNDLHSLEIATGFLDQQTQHPLHTLILSDIQQAGKPAHRLYQEVADILRNRKIDRLVSIGPGLGAHQKYFGFIPDRKVYGSVEEFLEEMPQLHFSGEAILVKGARAFGFERISRRLEQKTHQTVLSINLNALVDNYKAYRSRLHPSTRVMAMVKAFSYGSGGYEVASVLQYHQVDYLAVAYADEGVELRKAGIRVPVMVMNSDPESFGNLVEYHLEPEIYSNAILNEFLQYLRDAGISQYPVHLKIDTGMHRLGFEPAEMGTLGDRLRAQHLVRVESVFSHLAASDDPKEYAFTRAQFSIFKKCCQQLQDHLGYPFLRHISNTSAIARYPALQMDMVRLGIGLYGIDPFAAMQSRLTNVSTLKTTIAQIRKVAAGESVGYGHKHLLARDSVIATVRIGYADGYPRSLSGGVGKMRVRGKLAPTAGNVCMDMTMLDITGIHGVQEGDEVLVFGAELPLTSLAGWAGTIPYEIMTGISERVPRVYFEE
ncbi:MAG: bifunctional UDP-N-acetylmuramoyl-tripeptide:D-alanyl-D-alanine ligase/alanine racemase [Bacteroidota bacterium]|nr:bifunctional UDP-N-acetylmuramoyl-tripeptide:D-alanyl-D-alanine ligase/alanine racemase [Bacteroidota bacterium]